MKEPEAAIIAVGPRCPQLTKSERSETSCYKKHDQDDQEDATDPEAAPSVSTTAVEHAATPE